MRMPHIITLETPYLTDPHLEGGGLYSTGNSPRKGATAQISNGGNSFLFTPQSLSLVGRRWVNKHSANFLLFWSFPALLNTHSLSSSSRSLGCRGGRRNSGHWRRVGRRTCPSLYALWFWGHSLYPWKTILSLWKLPSDKLKEPALELDRWLWISALPLPGWLDLGKFLVLSESVSLWRK